MRFAEIIPGLSEGRFYRRDGPYPSYRVIGTIWSDSVECRDFGRHGPAITYWDDTAVTVRDLEADDWTECDFDGGDPVRPRIPADSTVEPPVRGFSMDVNPSFVTLRMPGGVVVLPRREALDIAAGILEGYGDDRACGHVGRAGRGEHL